MEKKDRSISWFWVPLLSVPPFASPLQLTIFPRGTNTVELTLSPVTAGRQGLLVGRTEGHARGAGKSCIFHEKSPDCLALVVSGKVLKADEFIEQVFSFGPNGGFIEKVLGLDKSGTPAGRVNINRSGQQWAGAVVQVHNL